MNVIATLLNTISPLELSLNTLTYNLRGLSYIVDVEVASKNNKWFNFQITTNQEFLSDEELDEIFELVLDANFDLRVKTGEKIYFKHSFVGVEKYYVEEEEFDNYYDAFRKAKTLVDGDWLTDEGLEPYQLIEVREI